MQKNDLYLEGKSFIGKVWDSVPEDIRKDTVFKFCNTGKIYKFWGFLLTTLAITATMT